MTRDRRMLDMAARAALRGAGRVEPNPMVGAVIARGDEVLGIGHHRRFGDLHAEREALRSCSRRGFDPAGATMYVTLEPCAHTGKQPPCTEAVIAAGIREVVIARADPGEVSGGGAAVLRAAGVGVRFSEASSAAVRVSDAFVKRTVTGLPWVIAKWAQTIDGKVATRLPHRESQWISCPTSRRQVHRLRGRVDAILTGIGTVLADDPMLTVRGVRARRSAPLPRRVVVDGRLETPIGSKLATSARESPLAILCSASADEAQAARRRALEAAGAEVIAIEGRGEGDRVDLAAGLRTLVERHGVATVLVEAGPGLLGSLFEADLVDECVVYVAPMVIGDEEAMAAVGGRVAQGLREARRLELVHVGHAGADAVLRYRRPLQS